MGSRYFSATVMGGQLYVQGVPERGPWDVKRLSWWSEGQVESVFQPLAGDRKVETLKSLEEAIRSSAHGLPTIKVWIHEGLQNAARSLWEEARAKSRM